MTGYKSATVRAKWIYTIFAAMTILSVILIAFIIVDAGLVQDLIDGRFVSESQEDASQTRMNIANWAQLGLMIIGAIVFLMWVHRSHKNLPYLGVKNLKFSHGWAVGWFFIPFCNLIQPYRVISEVWKGSDPDVNPSGNVNYPLTAKSTRLILIWWGLFLLSCIVRIVAGVVLRPEEPTIFASLLEYREYWDDLLVQRYSIIFSQCIFVFGFLATIYLVWKTDHLQENKHIIMGDIAVLGTDLNPDPSCLQNEQLSDTYNSQASYQRTGWYTAGVVLLSICALLWFLLVVSMITEPEDGIGSLIAGGIFLTAIPFGLGIYGIKHGKKMVREVDPSRLPVAKFEKPNSGAYTPKQIPCPYCQKLVWNDWQICSHCGETLVGNI